MNKLNYSKLSSLPSFLRSLLYVHEGFLVGGSALWIADYTDKIPRDYDVIIPLTKWSLCSKSLPKGSTTNTFGGIKVVIEGITIDVWAQDISDYLTNLVSIQNGDSSFCIAHPKTNTILVGAQGINSK